MLNLQDKPPRYNVTEAKFAQNKEHFMKHRDKLSWTFPQVAIVVLLLFCTISTAPAQTTLPAEDIAEKALAATVYLEMKDKNGKTLGIGSGFFVKPNLIATNYHVIEGAAKGTAKLVGKYTTYNIEGVTATDKTNDLALLKVTAYGIKPLSLGDSDAVRIGATVYVAGNPKGLEGTFSDGIISSRRDKLTKERLQMTAPISPGSSGGPVLNRKGEVIGVSFMTLEGGQNLNFAIPSGYLKAILVRSGIVKPLAQDHHFVSAETYFNWGNTKYHMGNYGGAVLDYNKSIRLNPNVPSYFNRGLAKYRMGQYFAAIADYDTAISRRPNKVDAYVNRGVAKDNLGRHFAAISDFDIAIRLEPDAADAYYNRGVAKVNLGQHSAAIADYDIAISLKPDFTIAYNNRGLAKAELGQFSDAIADYDTVISLKPDTAEAYLNRGVVKVKLGQNFAAITDFDIAIRLKPDDAKAYINRGVANIKLKRTLEAKQDFETALKLAEKTADARLKAQIEKMLLLIELQSRNKR